jgi:hypothetical protein
MLLGSADLASEFWSRWEAGPVDHSLSSKLRPHAAHGAKKEKEKGSQTKKGVKTIAMPYCPLNHFSNSELRAVLCSDRWPSDFLSRNRARAADPLSLSGFRFYIIQFLLTRHTVNRFRARDRAVRLAFSGFSQNLHHQAKLSLFLARQPLPCAKMKPW